MSRSRITQPAYQFHVSGQAKVRLGHRDYYLGKHGTPKSYARYYALLAEYNAAGKVAPEPAEAETAVQLADDVIRVKHITADFRERVLPDYIRNDAHHGRFIALLALVEKRHGDEPAVEFGPRKLEAIRDTFTAKGNCRSYANDQTQKIVKIFEHGVARELLAPDRIVALRALPLLKPGQAKDNPKRCGVALEAVRATLPHLTDTAAAMVKLQLSTAMRPSELFTMTPAQIDRTGTPWFYRPVNHKTQRHGKTKAVPILGDALRALAPFMFGDPDELCFRTCKGTPWNKDSYRIAIARAAKAAKCDHWTPYALRHTAAQAVRDATDAECTQALLGHSRLSTTEIYAQVSEARAVQAAMAAPSL